MQPTADPYVFLEEKRDGYARYRRVTDGRRWEVHGYCDRRGDCLIGMWVPELEVEIRDHEHLAEVREQLGRERIDSEMDVPVTPEFEGCCPFTYTDLEPLPASEVEGLPPARRDAPRITKVE